jgi:hypothetical protein
MAAAEDAKPDWNLISSSAEPSLAGPGGLCAAVFALFGVCVH